MTVILQEVLREFPLAAFACQCGCDRIKLSKRLALAFVRMCKRWNVDPGDVEILSGYRCELHNRKEGGSPRSRHPFGEGIDWRIRGLDLATMYQMAQDEPEFARGGIGLYADGATGPFLHTDVRPYVHRWGRVANTYTKGEEGATKAIEEALRLYD